MKQVEVEIVNWEKYQTRKDLKSMNFFRVQANIFSDSKFIQLKPTTKLSWFYLLSMCAQHNSKLIRCYTQVASKLAGVKPKLFLDALFELEQFQLVKLKTRDESEPREEKRREEKTREEKRESHLGLDEAENPAPKDLILENSEPEILNSHWLVELWNENSGQLPKCRVPVSAERLRKIKTRVKSTDDRDRWREAILKLAESSFCNGENDRSWIAGFDFLIQPGKLDVILEGKYDDRSAPKTKVDKQNQKFSEMLSDIQEGKL